MMTFYRVYSQGHMPCQVATALVSDFDDLQNWYIHITVALSSSFLTFRGSDD